MFYMERKTPLPPNHLKGALIQAFLSQSYMRNTVSTQSNSAVQTLCALGCFSKFLCVLCDNIFFGIEIPLVAWVCLRPHCGRNVDKFGNVVY
jgi:hypothetical protein